MPLEQPSYIYKHISETPIDYKWNEDIALDFITAESNKLYDAIDLSNPRAMVAIGIAVTEWVIWRFKEHSELIKDAHDRVEAAWAGLINPKYSKNLQYKVPTDQDKSMVDGPVGVSLYLLGLIYQDYIDNSEYQAEPVMQQVLLVRHLILPKKTFTQWLEDILEKTSKKFPNNGSDILISRSFFEPSFIYSKESIKSDLEIFLSDLDFNKNKYLLDF